MKDKNWNIPGVPYQFFLIIDFSIDEKQFEIESANFPIDLR